MNNFAEYILNEQGLMQKLEITYYLSEKTNIFFNKSTIVKTEIARLFLDYNEPDVDKNLVITACILCNCKKENDTQKFTKLKTYAKEGAEYLATLGFDDKFCKICEQVNRYSESTPREKEGDILELVDNFGGMLIDRPERAGFDPEESLFLLEHRNLKGIDNMYLTDFIEFIKDIEQIETIGTTSMSPIKRLIRIFDESKDVKQCISKVLYEYEPKVDCLIEKRKKQIKDKMFEKKNYRAMFSEETTQKILRSLGEEKIKSEEQ